MATKNGSTAPDVLEEVAAAAAATPSLSVPIEVVAELVTLGLQTELGDSFWRGFCAGRGYPLGMRLGIEKVEAVAAARPPER